MTEPRRIAVLALGALAGPLAIALLLQLGIVRHPVPAVGVGMAVAYLTGLALSAWLRPRPAEDR